MRNLHRSYSAHPLGPGPDQEQDQQRRHRKQAQKNPQDRPVALRLIEDSSRHHRPGEASPAVEEAHHPSDGGEILSAEKVPDGGPDDGEGRVQQGTGDGVFRARPCSLDNAGGLEQLNAHNSPSIRPPRAVHIAVERTVVCSLSFLVH